MIHFEVRNNLTPRFNRIAAAVQDDARALEKARTESQAEFGRQFISNQRVWRELSAPYAQWKMRHFGSLPKLVLRGDMRAGYLRSGEITPHTLTIHYPTDYAKHHQKGTSKMPARPFRLRAFDRVIGQVFLNHVKEAIKA